MFLTRVRLLLTTFWVGSLWTVGFVAAPILFSTLADRALAGTIANSLFRAEAWLSLVCGGGLMLLWMRQAQAERKLPLLLAVGMLACTLIGYFGLQPFMQALRESAGAAGVMASAGRAQFAVLHGVSSTIYLVESLLGAALVLRTR
jgi:hypothetical protein